MERLGWSALLCLLAISTACVDHSSETLTSAPQPATNGARTTVLSNTTTPPAAEPEVVEPPVYLGGLTTVSDVDAEVVFEARERLVQQCMADLGYEYTPTAPTPTQLTNKETLYPPPDLLAEFGYAWRSHLLTPVEEETSATVGYREGTPGLAGCGESADEQLATGTYRQASQVLTNADSFEIEASVTNDERTILATWEWAKCMSDQDYYFASWGQAERSTYTEGTDSPSALALAKVDYGCRNNQHVYEIDIEVRREYVAAWITSHPAELAALEAAQQTMVERAKAILAGGVTP